MQRKRTGGMSEAGIFEDGECTTGERGAAEIGVRTAEDDLAGPGNGERARPAEQPVVGQRRTCRRREPAAAGIERRIAAGRQSRRRLQGAAIEGQVPAAEAGIGGNSERTAADDGAAAVIIGSAQRHCAGAGLVERRCATELRRKGTAIEIEGARRFDGARTRGAAARPSECADGELASGRDVDQAAGSVDQLADAGQAAARQRKRAAILVFEDT